MKNFVYANAADSDANLQRQESLGGGNHLLLSRYFLFGRHPTSPQFPSLRVSAVDSRRPAPRWMAWLLADSIRRDAHFERRVERTSRRRIQRCLRCHALETTSEFRFVAPPSSA